MKPSVKDPSPASASSTALPPLRLDSEYFDYDEESDDDGEYEPIFPDIKQETSSQGAHNHPEDELEDETTEYASTSETNATGFGASKRFRSEGFLSQVIPIAPFSNLRPVMDSSQSYYYTLQQMESNDSEILCSLETWNLPPRLLHYMGSR